MKICFKLAGFTTLLMLVLAFMALPLGRLSAPDGTTGTAASDGDTGSGTGTMDWGSSLTTHLHDNIIAPTSAEDPLDATTTGHSDEETLENDNCFNQLHPNSNLVSRSKDQKGFRGQYQLSDNWTTASTGHGRTPTSSY